MAASDKEKQKYWLAWQAYAESLGVDPYLPRDTNDREPTLMASDLSAASLAESRQVTTGTDTRLALEQSVKHSLPLAR